MNSHKYTPELKEKVLRLYLEEGRSKEKLTEEYNLGQGTLTYWLQQRRKECQPNSTIQEENDSYVEILRLLIIFSSYFLSILCKIC